MSDLTPSHPDREPSTALTHQRKRVVAREVTAAEVELANRDAAALPPDLIIPSREPAPPNEAVVVVDPTTLGQRHRRHGHHRVYRWTQATTLLSALASTVSIFCTLGEDLVVAKSIAGPALALGLVATVLSGRNTLAARWRGWAIAATVFAATALGLTWIAPALWADPAPAPHRRA
jgi:hypothetical protein